MKLSLILLSFILKINSIKSKPHEKIIGGTDAIQGEYPFLVSIQESIFEPFENVCSGILIEDDLVLTAGECVVQNQFYVYRVRAGTIDLTAVESEGQIRDVVKAIFHPDYQGIGPNDLVLLKLESAFKLDENVQLALLPPQDAEIGGDGVVIGWGAIEEVGGAPTYPNIAQKANFTPLSDEECKERLDALIGADLDPYNSNANLCAQSDATVCAQDTGNPLILDNLVIGLGTWTLSPCTADGIVNVFTQISFYIDWINSIRYD